MSVIISSNFFNTNYMYIITGGGRGIGRALALELAKEGQSVLIVGRDEKALAETKALSSSISYLPIDVSITSDRLRLVAHLGVKTKIKGLIHNAGIIEPIAPISEIKEDLWRKCMATNLDAPLFLTQLLEDKLTNGRVLNIGSGAAYFPIKGWAAYCVSKAGLSMLTRCLQLESNNIAFASVMPGIIDTDMQALIRHAKHMDEDKQNFFRSLKESKRLVSKETVAAFLSWLLLKLDRDTYIANEWDIYDSTHHKHWLFPPNEVLPFE